MVLVLPVAFLVAIAVSMVALRRLVRTAVSTVRQRFSSTEQWSPVDRRPATFAGFALVALWLSPYTWMYALAGYLAGWSDPDGDGLYLDFQAGAYSWLDRVGHWHGGLWMAVSAVAFAGLWLTSRERAHVIAHRSSDVGVQAET